MEFKQPVFNGPTQINEGNGTMYVSTPSVITSIQKSFEEFAVDNKMTTEEVNAITPILKDLDQEAKGNPEKLKAEGSSTWLTKITTALKGVATVATIANAPWWAPLKTLIESFISSL